MILIITILSFLMSLLFLLPLSELFPEKYLHKTVTTIISQQNKNQNKAASSIFKNIYPLINWSVVLFRIDGYAPRWNVIREKLRVANLEQIFTVEQFIGLKYLASSFIFIYFLFLNLIEHSFFFILLGVIMALIGFFLPDQWLNIKIRKKRYEIQKEIPSILISLAVTADSGLSLLQAIEEVSNRKSGALPEEFRKTLQEISVGIPQKEAFENMADRVLVDELTLFVSVLIQSLEKGAGGVTQVLREQANEAWNRRKSKAKELGEKASIKLFLPLIGLALPALMIFLITPAIFSLLKFFVY
ncbi:hypothetical protein BHF71_10070 [Vulcanibacillus modesticaldus]|uniref:Type II secretion system protein GspF domain-containing protein n=1 Tax=Vulcanibacillus modesticaldus TaxID=337097 RepID=A0A1D2YTV7_9BACI|nr:type II secretion system F family protein [Vulcanibacillus modesticaldus]OEF99140.1 hypothetical protein BHF71_10070 [Vulcanibacillus modesticaldus]